MIREGKHDNETEKPFVIFRAVSMFFFYYTNQSAQHHLAADLMYDVDGFAAIPEGYEVPTV